MFSGFLVACFCLLFAVVVLLLFRCLCEVGCGSIVFCGGVVLIRLVCLFVTDVCVLLL